jgi:hypothetical protein
MEAAKPKKQRKRSRKQVHKTEADACVGTEEAIDEHGRDQEVTVSEETVLQQDTKLSQPIPVSDEGEAAVSEEQKSGHSEAVGKDVTDNVDDVSANSEVVQNESSLLEHGGVAKPDSEETTVHDRNRAADKVTDDEVTAMTEKSDESEKAVDHHESARAEDVAIIEDISIVEFHPSEDRLFEGMCLTSL